MVRSSKIVLIIKMLKNLLNGFKSGYQNKLYHPQKLLKILSWINDYISFTIRENHIGLAVSEISSYRQAQDIFVFITLLFRRIGGIYLSGNQLKSIDYQVRIINKVEIRVGPDIRFGRISGNFQYTAGYRILKLSGYPVDF